MADLSKLLTPDDEQIINATSGTSWVPKDPREVLLPYMESKTEELDLDKRKNKAKEVIDGYENVINECKRLEAEIEERCKNVVVDIKEPNHLSIRKAMGRVFGQGMKDNITFEEYKICIKELARLNNDLPNPGDKS